MKNRDVRKNKSRVFSRLCLENNSNVQTRRTFLFLNIVQNYPRFVRFRSMPTNINKNRIRESKNILFQIKTTTFTGHPLVTRLKKYEYV